MKLNLSIKQKKIWEFLIAMSLILIGAALRLLPHLPNFTPIAAIALFGGVYLSRKLALILPLAAMVVSDIFIGSYQFSLMAFVYGSFLLSVILGFWLKKHKTWRTILGGAVFSSLLFFFLTNFAVWLFTPWYLKTISGLLECYFMALPFFRNTLLGDLFYAGVFFGAYELAEIWLQKKFKIYETKIVANKI